MDLAFKWISWRDGRRNLGRYQSKRGNLQRQNWKEAKMMEQEEVLAVKGPL